MHPRFIEKYFSLQSIWRLTDTGLVSQEFNKETTSDQKNSIQLQKEEKSNKSYIAGEDKVS